MDAEQLARAAEEAQRLNRLNEMFDRLSACGELELDLNISGSGMNHNGSVRADRLLRAVTEEINDIVDELSGLGIKGLRKKAVE